MSYRPDRELPPTAGLPLAMGDLRARPGKRLTDAAAALLDVPATQLECSGTASLIVSLLALKELAPNRQEVVMPAYTCPLVPMAVRKAGLIPRLCDLAPGQFDMDSERLDAACGDATLAVLPTHLAGRIADVATSVAIARRAGAFVIEDAAQALGARHDGKSIGMLGHAGFFSLAAGKGLSIYEGGLLVASDPDLRARLARVSAEHVPRRPLWELRRGIELAGYAALYRPRGLRWAYGDPLRRALRRGDLVAAAGEDFGPDIPFHRVGRWRERVGATAIDRLPGFLRTTARQAMRRLPRLQAIEGLHVFSDRPGDEGTWPYFLIAMPDEATRDAALSRLWHAGLGVGRLFIHALPDYAYLGAMKGDDDVANARDFAACTLTVSNSPWIDDGTFEHICAVLEALVVRSRA
ncbi:dTDP-4-amino-4,6-dideoxygalactose transaminase [Luteibacter rhizovicinus]|uniref:dTDP-4-amino-4,6-dideoxygalactose transaminase n=1 Tax=Luteibacter rhizovicinus TaxID=242606 RepID=A0A4V6P460_9GAMM|nr:DegT/DnrJ/EryC1/StrS family aminotransferase [Luteibacter rhizovicinus]TCV95679.1 dTDP-4-amino-4,6-dideoxygalactose transaminase [Luteibacter rhizovicinus]